MEQLSSKQAEVPAIWRISLKLKGIGYLLEKLGNDPIPPSPRAMEDIQRGIGMIIADMGDDLADDDE